MKPQREFEEMELRLLKIAAHNSTKILREKKNLSHVRQCAFDFYDESTKETYQVQVTVTRDNADFLGDFETEEMTTVNK